MRAKHLTIRKRKMANLLQRTQWMLQLLLLVALIGIPLYRYQGQPPHRSLPKVNNEPLQIAPRYDDQAVVSDEQLIRVLARLVPKLAHDQPKINHVDHALRFWGLPSDFECPECLSGSQMREILLDHNRYANVWGENARPLLVNGNRGVAVRTQMGPATASHVDHTLASLSEVGTPLDFPVVTSHGTTSVDSIFRGALRSFQLNQQEYEWTTLALILHAQDAETWYSNEGQQISFDLLADRIMRQSYSQGVCYGNHRLYTLAILLRADEIHPLVLPNTRHRIVKHLQEATERLAQSQHEDGYWDETWASDCLPLDRQDTERVLGRKLLATGHALEWWAMGPELVLPDRRVVIRAGQWLVNTIEQLDDEQIKNNYTFLSHAGRALALWRKQLPADLVSRLETNALTGDSK